MKLGFVIPAYNEEKTIHKTVQALVAHGIPIVVNDCSKDRTASRAAEAGATVVNHTINGGYDKALNSGFRKALELGLTHVITFDADGQHPAELISTYRTAFDEGYGMVVGVRPQKQRFSESFFALYTRLAYGISDPLCGMKGYDLSYFPEIGFFDSFGSTGTELMQRYLKKKVKTKQVPIPIYPREDEPRFGSVIKGNWRILKSLFKSWVYIR